MSRKLKTLKRVKDRFSLFNDGRKLSANKRNYIVKAVQNMISSPKTQELLRLGEAYGFYGHQPRQRARKLDIGESEVIMISGRPVVVENIPSNRTINISCSDDGIVTHEQEFFDTETGRIALSLYESGAGGWSWATGGRDTPQASITNSFHGMDYVLQPNYLSLDHPSMMLESAGQTDMLLESLQRHGFDEESANNIVLAAQNAPTMDTSELENQVMYLEGINAELQNEVERHSRSTDMLLEAVEGLPIFISDTQREALTRLNSDEDLQIVKAMFESLGKDQAATLPTSRYSPASVGSVTGDNSVMKNAISFEKPGLRFQ